MSTDSRPLTGRNAIVTGGSRGLGAQIALDLARVGANVLIVSIAVCKSATMGHVFILTSTELHVRFVDSEG